MQNYGLERTHRKFSVLESGPFSFSYLLHEREHKTTKLTHLKTLTAKIWIDTNCLFKSLIYYCRLVGKCPCIIDVRRSIYRLSHLFCGRSISLKWLSRQLSAATINIRQMERRQLLSKNWLPHGETGLRAGWPGFGSRQGKLRNFSLRYRIQASSGSHRR
jgi:hypothetical protein